MFHLFHECCSSDMPYYAFPLAIIILICFLPCFCCCFVGWLCSRCCNGGTISNGTYLTSTTSATSTTCVHPLPSHNITPPSEVGQLTSTQYIPEAILISDIPEAVVIAAMPQPSAPPLPISHATSYGSTKNNY